MPPVEPSNLFYQDSTSIGLKKCSVVETQEKNFKLAIINMFRDPKDDVATQLEEIMKLFKA